jgi:Predicted acyl-CoA transferases/carnitine dehydratase
MRRIFDGIKVLDFTALLAGPICSALLADQGADVIKIERPHTGEDGRMYPPYVGGESTVNIINNRGKRSFACPMDDPDGVEILKELIKTTDVLVQNYRPGTMNKFGLDYDSVKLIKPDIIYCSISAYGLVGPYSYRPGYDLIGQAATGLMDLSGEPGGSPLPSAAALTDTSTGNLAFAAVASALYHRLNTGEGNHIDMSMTDCFLSLNNKIEEASAGLKPTRTGKFHDNAGPFGVFSGNDFDVVICAPNPGLWKKLCGAIGKPELADDPRYDSSPKRVAQNADMIEILEGFLKSCKSTQEAVDMIDKAGVPVAKINTTTEVLTDPHYIARGSIITQELPSGEKFTTRGIVHNYSNTPGKISPAPSLAQHNTEILKALGRSDEEVSRLNAKWVTK